MSDLQPFNYFPNQRLFSDSTNNDSSSQFFPDVSCNRVIEIPQTPKMNYYLDDKSDDKQNKNNIINDDLSKEKTEPMTFKANEGHQGGIIKLTNVVSMFNAGCKLNLKKIAQECEDAEYKEEKFIRVEMKFKGFTDSPGATALINSSGKINLTGVKSKELAKEVGKTCVARLKEIGYDAQFNEFEIVNMYATYNFGFKINLMKLSKDIFQNIPKKKLHNKKNKKPYISYEPEIFPALRYGMEKPKLTVSIYHSGNIIISGGKKMEDFQECIEKIEPFVKNCKTQII